MALGPVSRLTNISREVAVRLHAAQVWLSVANIPNSEVLGGWGPPGYRPGRSGRWVLQDPLSVHCRTAARRRPSAGCTLEGYVSFDRGPRRLATPGTQ